MRPCTHRWRIEEANGSPTVPGRCQLCGAARDFPAAEPDAPQDRGKLADALFESDRRRRRGAK